MTGLDGFNHCRGGFVEFFEIVIRQRQIGFFSFRFLECVPAADGFWRPSGRKTSILIVRIFFGVARFQEVMDFIPCKRECGKITVVNGPFRYVFSPQLNRGQKAGRGQQVERSR